MQRGLSPKAKPRFALFLATLLVPLRAPMNPQAGQTQQVPVPEPEPPTGPVSAPLSVLVPLAHQVGPPMPP